MSRLRALWFRSRTDLLFWSVSAGAFLLTFVAYARWFRMYYPDSRYYLARTYLFLGHSPESARDLTIAYSAPRGISIPDVDLLFGWGLVQPRVVLPALSMPFVAWFGPAGLAIVPFLATVLFLVLVLMLVRRRYGTLPALAVGLLLNLSMFLVSYETGMLTEGLSSLFTLLALLAAWRWLVKPRPWLLVAMGGVTVVSAFTRQATFIVGGAFLLAWLMDMMVRRRWRSAWMWPALVVAGAAIVCQVTQSLLFPSFSQADQFTAQTGTHSLGEAILASPKLLLEIVKEDTLSMLRNDRALLVLISLALLGMILFWRRAEAHLLFGALMATALYNVTNGTPTAFRYAMPGLAFWVLCAAMTIAATATWIRPRQTTNLSQSVDASESAAA